MRDEIRFTDTLLIFIPQPSGRRGYLRDSISVESQVVRARASRSVNRTWLGEVSLWSHPRLFAMQFPARWRLKAKGEQQRKGSRRNRLRFLSPYRKPSRT